MHHSILSPWQSGSCKSVILHPCSCDRMLGKAKKKFRKGVRILSEMDRPTTHCRQITKLISTIKISLIQSPAMRVASPASHYLQSRLLATQLLSSTLLLIVGVQAEHHDVHDRDAHIKQLWLVILVPLKLNVVKDYYLYYYIATFVIFKGAETGTLDSTMLPLWNPVKWKREAFHNRRSSLLPHINCASVWTYTLHFSHRHDALHPIRIFHFNYQSRHL